VKKPNQYYTIALALFLMPGAQAYAQGTAFTYQGQLNYNNGPASGTYNFTFSLYATNTGGLSIAGPVTNTLVAVSNGLFTATIDFGQPFTGGARWLEIGVETNGATSFTVLAPRQPVTPVPYAISAENVTGPLALSQLPATVVTNGATGLNLTGSFSGNGSFSSLSVGNNFAVDSSGNITAANISIPATVNSTVMSENIAPNPTNYQFYPLDITASNFVVLGTAIIANPIAPSDFVSSPQTGITNGAGVDPPSWSLAFGIDGSNFVFQTLDAGQGTIISVDGHDASPAIALPNDGNQNYVQVNLSAPGYHWIILKNINNAFGIFAPVTNGFFSTPPFAYTTLAIMGDSFEDITPTNTYADYLGEVVPALNVCKFGEGGTGWEATQNPTFGYTNFLGRLNDMKKVNPAYILFAGGINDHTFAGANSNAFYQIVYNTAVAAKAAYPNAHFAVVSPFWPRSPADPDVYVTGTIISNACVAAGLINSNQFFNILSPPLVTGNQAIPNSGTADQYTSADTTHPTPKGAAAIAHWLAAKMATIWPQLFNAAPAR
jgi:lysophospholipase L1-like esterase